MSTVVWKYEIPVADRPQISMPEGATILMVAEQNDVPCIWVRVDPSRPVMPRRFQFAGTGHPLPDGVGRHVGSIMLSGASFVFHLFELED